MPRLDMDMDLDNIKELGLRLFVERTKEITLRDLAQNHSVDLLLNNTIEELGEFAAANTVENGFKKKDLKESAKIEAVDVTICALALFFAKGGTVEELTAIGQRKLDKWEARV